MDGQKDWGPGAFIAGCRLSCFCPFIFLPAYPLYIAVTIAVKGSCPWAS
jgi:hypothetical protein